MIYKNKILKFINIIVLFLEPFLRLKKMQLNRHKILEIILLKENKYNKRCLPVESS